ncbi:MAG: Prolipoprotein diacylglyceryl transferase [Firmicutes bacterium ADurb.Bin193]|nr:MAG: Prolipoprotein diacylglyceryl transferase [Firmicutes bacterium ADurb.Bin193]
MNTVNFPGLGIYLKLNRVAFSIGTREVYWYGLIIVAGILLAIVFGIYEARRAGLPKDSVVDTAIVAIPVGIICARLYFVFWNWSYYAQKPLEILNFRGGGLAIYGGIIGGTAAGYIYCRIKKMDYQKMFDVGAFGFLIGQAVGRWGNFVNAEAYGIQTRVPWRMEVFNNEMNSLISVHPTFLYESLWNIIGFIGLYLYRTKKKFEGEIFLLYVAWYGIGRAWIEQLRADSLPYSATFKISQIVAALTAIAALFIIAIKRKKLKKEEEPSV